MRRALLLLAAVVVAWIGSPCLADDSVLVRPVSASRFVQSFDFEERLTNPNPVPLHWSRVYDAPPAKDASPQRPVLPTWNQAELVFTSDGHPAASGEGSVRLPTNGGSTRLVLDSGVVPVFAGADYRIHAKVRTKGLKYARARMLIRFLERDGTPITASERSSNLLASQDEWTRISLELVGEYPKAAFLQVQLDLLQPAQFAGAPDPKETLLPEDLSGCVYFDDVQILQLPRAEITTSAPLNIAVWPQVPDLIARIRDLTGERLTVRIETFDSRGAIIDAVDRAIAGADRIVWTPKIKSLGWFRAVMTISAASRPIGSDSVDFVVVPSMSSTPGAATSSTTHSARISSSDRKLFGVIAGPVPDGVLTNFAELPRRIGTGSIMLDATGESTAPDAPLARAVSQSLEEWQDVTLLVTRLTIPGTVADRPLFALGTMKEALASIEPLLDRFGQRVRRFQFSRCGDDGWFWEPEANDPRAANMALKRYVSGPIISMPMRLDRAPWIAPTDGVDATFFVPYGFSPRAVGEAVANLKLKPPRAGERQTMTLAFECAPEGLYSPRSAAADMVRRAVEAWAASPTAPPNMALIEPWSVLGPRRPQLMPRAELAAWRCLSDRLLDRRIVARFPTPEGTRAYLLGPTPGAPTGTTGAIVAWNDTALPEQAVLSAYLGGSEIRLLGIFGNEQVPQSEASKGGPSEWRTESGVRVALGSEPVFIEGVDTALARFLSDFRLEPSSIEPGRPSSDHQIILRNPFGTGISGTITLLSPSREDSRGATREWKVSPHVMRFAAAPGEVATLPLAIAAGSGLELGPQAFVFQVELSAGVEYPKLVVSRDLDVGLSNVRVNLSYRVQENNDLVLEVALANISDEPLNLSLTAFAPEQSRQTSSISALPPTNQAIRRFLYQGLANKLRGKRLSISLMDVDSNVRVAASIAIE